MWKFCRALKVFRFFTRETNASNIVHIWFLGHVHQCNLNSMHLIALNKACRKDDCQCSSNGAAREMLSLNIRKQAWQPRETKNSEASIKPQNLSCKCSSTAVIKITWSATNKRERFLQEK